MIIQTKCQNDISYSLISLQLKNCVDAHFTRAQNHPPMSSLRAAVCDCTLFALPRRVGVDDGRVSAKKGDSGIDLANKGAGAVYHNSPINLIK